MLDDLPTLPTLETGASGDDLIPVYDVSAGYYSSAGRSRIRALPFNTVAGLGTSDVTTVTGTSATISTRLTVFTSTSSITATLPAASGTLREVIIMKASSTSAVTVNRAGSDVIVSGTSTTATSISVAAGLTAILRSDGTTWYHISNDA